MNQTGRVLVFDEAAPAVALARALDEVSQSEGGTEVYVVYRIGEKRSRTPEGFLFCEDVPIARVGEMVYMPSEIIGPDGKEAVKAGDSGYVIVERTEEEVFREEFIASFEGKPVTLGHPPAGTFVSPETYKKLAVGTVLNPRRGTGRLDDFLVADLMITDAEAIDKVLSGANEETSAGYEAMYIQDKPGHAFQKNMVANHVALVKAARCGPRCVIGDNAVTLQGEPAMRAKTHDNAPAVTLDEQHPLRRWWTGVRAAVADALTGAIDPANVLKVLDSNNPKPEHLGPQPAVSTNRTGDEIHVHAGGRDEEAHEKLKDLEERVTAHDARHRVHDEAFAALKEHTGYDPEKKVVDEANKEIEGALREEAPAGTGDAAVKATDSEFLADAHQAAVSGAEVLVPGISVPTYDRAMEPAKTLDSICKLRRRALDMACTLPQMRPLIEQANGGKKLTLDTMSSTEVRTLFSTSVVAAKTAITAAQRARPNQTTKVAARDGGKELPKPIRSIKELNEMHANYWKDRVAH